MNRNGTCPTDRNLISRIYPHREKKDCIAQWKKNHFVLEVEPKQLAHYILNPDQIPVSPGEQHNEKFGAYLRYVTSIHKIQEVVARIVAVVKENGVELPDVRDKQRPKNFNKGSWAILKKILSDVREELNGQLSPRSSRMMDFMRSSQASLRDSFTASLRDSFTQSQAETVAMRDSLTQSRAENGAMRERIDDLLRRQAEADAQRRAAEEARSRGPSKLEVSQALLGVVGGVAATALGRGLGGVMDADPVTSFLSEASSVGKMDLLGAGLHAARVLWAYKKSDGHFVRRLNDRFSETIFASVAAGSHSYFSTIERTNTRIERAEHKSELDSMKNAITEVRDKVAKANKRADDANKLAEDAIKRAENADSLADAANFHAHKANKRADDADSLAKEANSRAAELEAAAKKASDDKAKKDAEKFCILS